MDLFTGPVGQNQIHDYDPGIPPSGLFWTAPIPLAAVQVDLGRVTAAMRLTDYATRDYFTGANSIAGGAFVPATVTMDIAWHTQTADVQIRDLVNSFAGHYSECLATASWSARQEGFSFTSAAAATSVTRFAALGRERNGIFFRGEDA